MYTKQLPSERKSMSRYRFVEATLLATALFASSCDGALPDQTQSSGENNEESSRSGLLLNTTYPSPTWWSRTVPACFTNGISDAEKDFWIRTVSASWEQALGLKFSWSSCPNGGTAKTINIGKNSAPNCTGGGNWCGSTGVESNWINLVVCADCFLDRRTIEHEIGHALGFDHEFQRPGYDRTTCSSADPTLYSDDYLHTTMDLASIMNGYCANAQYSWLSYQDIVGAQNKWGRPNYFADVTGDGMDDAIVVNPDGVYVMAGNGGGFSLPPVRWITSFWGWRGTSFADVTGDGKADMIVVDDRGLAFAPSTGGSFGPLTWWTSSPVFGEYGVYFADIDGNNRPSALAVSRNGIQGYAYGAPSGSPPAALWNNANGILGAAKYFFADVTGPDSDGKRRADLVQVVDGYGTYVCPKPTSGCFAACTRWSTRTDLTLLADIDGNGKDDFLALEVTASNPGLMNIGVLYSNGSSFGGAGQLTYGPFLPERGIFAAKMNRNSSQRSMGYIADSGVYYWDWTLSRTVNGTTTGYYGLR